MWRRCDRGEGGQSGWLMMRFTVWITDGGERGWLTPSDVACSPRNTSAVRWHAGSWAWHVAAAPPIFTPKLCRTVNYAPLGERFIIAAKFSTLCNTQSGKDRASWFTVNFLVTRDCHGNSGPVVLRGQLLNINFNINLSSSSGSDKPVGQLALLAASTLVTEEVSLCWCIFPWNIFLMIAFFGAIKSHLLHSYKRKHL